MPSLPPCDCASRERDVGAPVRPPDGRRPAPVGRLLQLVPQAMFPPLRVEVGWRHGCDGRAAPRARRLAALVSPGPDDAGRQRPPRPGAFRSRALGGPAGPRGNPEISADAHLGDLALARFPRAPPVPAVPRAIRPPEWLDAEPHQPLPQPEAQDLVPGRGPGQRLPAPQVLQERPVLELLRRPAAGDRGQPDGRTRARSGGQRAAAAMGPGDRGRATMTVAARAPAGQGALLYLLSFLPTYVQWELEEIRRRGIAVEVILPEPWPRSVLWDQITGFHELPSEGLRVRTLTF